MQSTTGRYMFFLLAGALLFWLPAHALDHPAVLRLHFLGLGLAVLTPTLVSVLGALYLRRRYPVHSVAVPLLALLGVLNLGPMATAAGLLPGSPVFPLPDPGNLVRYIGVAWMHFPLIAFLSVRDDTEFLRLALTTLALLGLTAAATWQTTLGPALAARHGARVLACAQGLVRRVGWLTLTAGAALAIGLAGWWSLVKLEPFRHDMVAFQVPPQCKDADGLLAPTVATRWEGDILVATVTESINCAYATLAASAQVFGDRILIRVEYGSPQGFGLACLCPHTTEIRLSDLPRMDYRVWLVTWP